SSRRYANNESSPLSVPYDTCEFQGIGAGWGDDYFAGLECQWIDVTDAPTETPLPLSFHFNPDQFLCEGSPLVDGAGKLEFDPTSYTSESGQPIDRPMCQFSPGWDANNLQSTQVTLPRKGGMVTAPCARGQLGPLRDCGWSEQSVSDCGDPV